MKKLFLMFSILAFGSCVFASDIDEVKSFFDSYVNASNSYKTDNFNTYYDSNPTIMRVVVKKDGTTKVVTIPFATYKKESKIGSKLGKLRGYKNKYSNITVEPEGSDYKLSALRQPSTSKYSLPAYFTIGKDANGKWKIKKEVMHTKVQSFLRRNS